jgi:hypothetical protein
MDVEVAHTQAWDAEPAVALLAARRTVVATEQRAESAKKVEPHMNLEFLPDVVETVRLHLLVLAVVGAGLGVAGIALVQAVELALEVALGLVGLALLGPPVVAAAVVDVVDADADAAGVAGAVDDTHLPSSP